MKDSTFEPTHLIDLIALSSKGELYNFLSLFLPLSEVDLMACLAFFQCEGVHEVLACRSGGY